MNVNISFPVIMIFDFYPLAIAIIALLFFLIFWLLKKQCRLQSVNRLNETIWNNAQGYFFLIDKKRRVKKTNYFAVNGLKQPKKEVCFGEIMDCKWAWEGGGCGFSEECKLCPVRNRIGETFENKNKFSDLEFVMNLYTTSSKKGPYNIMLSGVYLNLDKGEFVLLTVQDISKEKVLERSVRKTAQKFSTVFNNLPVACAICDRNGIFREVNDTYLEYMSVESTDDILGKINIFNNPCINEEFKNTMRKGMPLFEEVKYDFIRINREYMKSGHRTVKYFRFIVDYILSRKGEIESFVIIWVDNTLIHNTLKENKRFHDMVSFASSVSNIGFGSVNILKEEELATPEYLRNLGGKEDEDIRTLFANFSNVHPEDKKVLMDYWEEAKNQKTKPLEKDVRVRKNGEYHWIKQFIIQQIYDLKHNNIVLLGLNIDIDQQKRGEEELKKAKEKAISSDKLKSAFLANMSHEIRTPLNAIVGFSDLLAGTDDPQERENYKNIIHHNNELLLQLISDILDLSKIEADTLEFNWSEVDINSLLKDLEQTIRFKNTANKNVEINFVPGLPECVINTERTRISQVINNFLTNALKFTEKGSITFGYEECEEGLYFYVKDTGMGIQKEQLPKIFDRFVKLNNFKQGTGLGLAICQSIVSKLGGRIGVGSEFGKGSTFWFILPVRPIERKHAKVEIPVNEAATPEPKVETKPNPVPSSAKKKLLVAEDTVDNYKLFEIMLSKHYDLVHAWNGEEAISLFLNESPDAILMDIRMPVCDGYEATAAIRQMSAEIPIIAVTAFAYSEDKERILSSGFNAYLTKPVQSKELMNTLGELGI